MNNLSSVPSKYSDGPYKDKTIKNEDYKVCSPPKNSE